MGMVRRTKRGRICIDFAQSAQWQYSCQRIVGTYEAKRAKSENQRKKIYFNVVHIIPQSKGILRRIIYSKAFAIYVAHVGLHNFIRKMKEYNEELNEHIEHIHSSNNRRREWNRKKKIYFLYFVCIHDWWSF